MKLNEYKKKRDFSMTPEPKGDVKPSEGKIFVIQKHDARHLHYDLRLEMDGVLKSWALPKEPPTKPGIKRLAIKTEDHPVNYAGFEGTIPEGHYGAGSVEIWDNGTYEVEEKLDDRMVFQLKGKKMKGEFVLIRFKGEEKNWLFFKKK